MKTTRQNSDALPKLNPDWKKDLVRLLDEVLIFSEVRQGGVIVTKARSQNFRTLVEMVEKGRVLERASMHLTLPEQDELEMLKLSCWTLICLKCLFPGWKGVEQWVREVAENPKKVEAARVKQLCDYAVSFRYDPAVNVMDFEIVRSGRARTGRTSGVRQPRKQ